MTHFSTILREVSEQFKGQDEGSCVCGMELIIKGYIRVDQIAQGSITNERFFKAVRERIIAECTGYEAADFRISYGYMD